MQNRSVLSLLFIVISTFTLYAQKYGTTLGLRLANDQSRMAGLTMQQRLFKHVSIEGIIQSDLRRNTTVHGLVKKHYPVLGKRLNLFTGAGMSFGNEESIILDEQKKRVITTYDNATLGADLIVGAEITLLGLNVGVDYKPNVNLSGRENWYQGQIGISARLVLITDKTLKKKKRKRQRQKRRTKRKKDRVGN